MNNFRVDFTLSPWVLLLIIPAVAFTLFLYFRVEKRFRRIRKRTVSLVLHIIVFVCSIVALSGMRFTWEKDDVESELVILVDQSYSGNSSRERADDFVYDILEANGGRSQIAVVKFGYDQVLAVEMGKHNTDSAYRAYLNAAVPDTTATDIRSALQFVWDPATKTSGGDSGKTIIHYPESARILLVSDGLQTDRDAMSVAKLMALDGITIDTAFYPANYSNDCWIVDASYPDRSFDIGENFDFEVTVRSSYAGTFGLTFSDNGSVQYNQQSIALRAGLQTVKIPYYFRSSGHHELKFGLTTTGDTIIENNVFYAYYDLEEYNSILVIEKYDGESDKLVEIIKSRADAEYLTLKVINISEAPQTIEALSQYDEVILVNISHADMPKGFEDLLYDYVYNRGGGLFTVGGFEKDAQGNIKYSTDSKGHKAPVAHAYDETDMKNTTYQDMLPVKIEQYMPPIALVIIIDRSASMEQYNEMPFEKALDGALAAVNTMTSRDYVGVMVMQNSYHVELDITPMTQKSKIIDAVYRVADNVGGSNSETASIEHACRALATMKSVEKKHLLFLTDGEPGDPGREYQAKMESYNEMYGITCTVVSVVKPVVDDLKVLAEKGDGNAYYIPNDIKNQLPQKLKQDLGYEELDGAVEMAYTPTLQMHTPVVNNLTQTQLDTVDMNGFFVSRVKNSTVQVPLMAKYVPLYAQWKYGEGKVGSLLCDLDGYFSGELTDSEEVGVPILNNIVSSLMPVMNIRERTLNVDFLEDNYRTQASVEGYNAESEKDKKLVAIVKSPTGEVSKFDLGSLSPGGNRFTFENKEAGVHDVMILKVPRSFNIFDAKIKSVDDIADKYIMAILHTYRVFSYSQEYNASRDSFTEGKKLLIDLSTRTDLTGEDKLVTSPEQFFSTLVGVRKTFDPRYLLIGIAVALFLAEIALRKFRLPKFKQLLQKLGLKRKQEEGAKI